MRFMFTFMFALYAALVTLPAIRRVVRELKEGRE
jgi:hypothetical protein